MAVNLTKKQIIGTKAGENLFGAENNKVSRHDKLIKSKKATNEFTAFVIKYLNDSGKFVAWRSNNTPSTRIEVIKEEGKEDIVKVHFKKNQKTIAVLDVTGYRVSDGKHLQIEIKVGKDTLKPDQKQHLQAMQKAGCISFVTSTKHDFMLQITPFMEQKTAF